jgi:DNA invertase Pin-like site-specific DNA recombinase
MTAHVQDAAMPQRSYSYRRISTNGRQARGRGLDRQGDGWAAQVSAERGWVLDDTLDLTDKGRSGYHQKNLEPTAALGRFLALIGSRVSPGSILLVESLDRLSRASVDDAYDLFRRLLKAGITIVTREPFREYTPKGTGNMINLLEPLFIFARANEESSTKSFRARDAWHDVREAAAEGKPLPTAPPWWLHKTADGYEPIPDKVALLRRIHALAQEGKGCPTLRRLLRAEGIPSPRGREDWPISTLVALLRSRMPLGEYQPTRWTEPGRPKDGPPRLIYPAVMTEEEWLLTQGALCVRYHKRGRRGKDRVNLFTGLVTDRKTGLPLSMRTHLSHRRRYPILATDRGGWVIPYERFDGCVMDTLAMLTPRDVLPPSAKRSEQEAEIAVLAGRLVALDHRQQQL